MSHTTRIAVKVIIITTLALLFSLLFIAPAAAQKEVKEWKPAMIPADALKYGAEIEAAATPEFLRWARSFATGELRHMPVNPKAFMEVVDKKYAGTPDDARDAGIFLVEYLGYKDEVETEKMLASKLREISRKVYDNDQEAKYARDKEQKGMASRQARANSMTMDARVRTEAQNQKLDNELKELLEQERIKIQELGDSQKKINLYLKVLQITHERMNGIPPAAVAGLK